MSKTEPLTHVERPYLLVLFAALLIFMPVCAIHNASTRWRQCPVCYHDNVHKFATKCPYCGTELKPWKTLKEE